MSPVDKRRMCPNCRAFISTDDKICPYCNVPLAPRVVQRRAPADALGGLIPHANFTTMMLLLVNVGLYAATVLHSSRTGRGGFDIDVPTLVDFGAKYGPAIAAGQWWRLITAGFLHAGLLHILMNMWVLFDIGAEVEMVFGTSRYLFLYLATNVTAYLASLYLIPSVSIGASGAIFGLIGAMIAWGMRDRTSYGASRRRLYTTWAIFALVLSIIPGTDWAAHLGGIGGGLILGFIVGTPGYNQATERLWRVAAGIALGVTGLAFAEMFLGLIASSR